jgi:hypothetical protein
VRRLLLLALPAAVAVAVVAAPAGAATNECRGLQVCVPVAGPWVVLPGKRSVPRPQVQFQLSCPKGYIVGGTDAELSDKAIDVSFYASMGAPVNPGISTSADLVFVGTYVGNGNRLPSFRPHIGCMPTRGGGSRTPTAAVFPPTKPIVRHVKNFALASPGTKSARVSCAAGERLVDAKSAVAFDTLAPPPPTLAGAVSVLQSIHGDATTAHVKVRGIPAGTIPLVQVAAICTGGK